MSILDDRLLASRTTDHAEHVRQLGALPSPDPATLIRTVLDSGLTGRGGAAFSTGRKLAGIAERSRPVVVANGAEGEPACSKDWVLLAQAPHLVLDGLVLAAGAVRARSAYLYAPAELLDGPVRHALAQRRDPITVRTVAAPDTFISGQESTVVSVINGGPAVPSNTPPAVFERGVGGAATLVQNVETLANLALVARRGAAWFRSAGSPGEPGTRLFTVSGAVRHPGVIELAGGSSLGEIISAVGGAAEPLQALLIGGYHGGWVPWTAHTADLPCSKAELTRYEAAPGAGVVVALSLARCGLQAGADIAAYLAGQSAGQCGPCRNGLPTIADLLTDLARGRAHPDVIDQLDRIVGLVDGRGACHHPGGTARLVRSTLRTFRLEIHEHLAGRCSATKPHADRPVR